MHTDVRYLQVSWGDGGNSSEHGTSVLSLCRTAVIDRPIRRLIPAEMPGLRPFQPADVGCKKRKDIQQYSPLENRRNCSTHLDA